MRISPDFLSAAVLTTALGFLMVRLGLRKRMLDARPPGRCASCGRRLEGRFCPHCAGR